ncbi:hypothetical protein EVJ58_g5201 [Rhodofomes roseus]|uniref:B30.2/SPRY domain-containing protein n=1 Tax=Rhodofomes roseus TaxID=34475 RepID=A0A4Y9YEB4_9APHY|nr:hypothetical protein EVJ58_g5201 [Rhodofomes roseus]
MSTRPTRSASIPIPSSTPSAARNLEDVLSIPFVRQPSSGAASRPRLPVASHTAQTSKGSEALARATAQRVGTPTNADLSAPTFQPRIIRAASNPTPSRDPIACLPGAAPAPSTSPVRSHRLGDRPSTTPVAPRLSASLSAGSRVHPSFTHSASANTVPTTAVQAFPRPTYLEYSALRDFLHTDTPAIVPPARNATIVPHPLTPVVAPQPYPYLRRSLTPADSDSENTPSPSPPPHDTASTANNSLGALSANPVLRLPTRWSEQDRSTVLTISPDGQEVTFHGPSCTGEKDSAAARANFAIPPACGIYYYEVEIIQRGQKGHISIGFSAGNVRLSRLPGWEHGSWGYHADDGWCFAGTKDGTPYGPTFDSGDVIGCGIDFSQHRAFYTKNGAFLGM